MSKTETVRIFDTTLRDGYQTPGASLNPENKVVIARQLDRLGVDAIEAGMPVTSKGEFESFKRIAREGLKAEVYGLARLIKDDIDAVVASDTKYIHLFIATSDIHLKHKLKKSRAEVLQMALEMIDYARDHGLTVEFSAEDATRTNIHDLKKVYHAISEAKVRRINIPDTVGIMTPEKMEHLVEVVKSVVDVPISVHCHDDFGMAVANSLVSIKAGANQVHATINGLGERAGNASLEEIVTSLDMLYDRKTGVDTTLLYQTSQLVSKLMGIVIQPNKSIVGENAFTHEAGIHTHGLIAHPLTYEPIPPAYVGRRRRFVAGKYSGTHGIRAKLEELDIHPTNGQLKEVIFKIKDLGSEGKRITDDDLIDITKRVMGGVDYYDETAIKLNELAVMTGTKMMSTASVSFTMDGKIFSSAETGVGPVDAAVKAIQKTMSPLVNVQLKEYRLEALTGGSDAVAEVIIKVEDDNGNVVSSRSANEDIVKASVEAMIKGIDRILLLKKRQKQGE